MPIKTDLLIPLIVFCAATLLTPGPNNVMLMTSGLNFGLKKSLPHLFGVVSGFAFLVLCIGLGLGVLFTAYPLAYTILKYAGAAYLLYLAWMIAKAGPAQPGMRGGKRPMGFFAAVAFQWVNPKAWIMGIGAISTYAAIAPYPANAFLIAGLFGGMGIGSSFAWTSFGTVLQNPFGNPKILRAFNIVMAVLLAASIYPVFAE